MHTGIRAGCSFGFGKFLPVISANQVFRFTSEQLATALIGVGIFHLRIKGDKSIADPFNDIGNGFVLPGARFFVIIFGSPGRFFVVSLRFFITLYLPANQIISKHSVGWRAPFHTTLCFEII